ncbi:hypothetical protein AQUCO_02700012v1 [Aquilegia coerulea]|uniref:Uncharacterized protein n=1 Tax=Aquilegia coerulea TaxID=218851 RepID=A0A2G5D4S1_AQUCA|nr:hypothetical protein AQUCO_02700012v1 [Aquilegia coerulea]
MQMQMQEVRFSQKTLHKVHAHYSDETNRPTQNKSTLVLVFLPTPLSLISFSLSLSITTQDKRIRRRN